MDLSGGPLIACHIGEASGDDVSGAARKVGHNIANPPVGRRRRNKLERLLRELTDESRDADSDRSVNRGVIDVAHESDASNRPLRRLEIPRTSRCWGTGILRARRSGARGASPSYGMLHCHTQMFAEVNLG